MIVVYSRWVLTLYLVYSSLFYTFEDLFGVGYPTQRALRLVELVIQPPAL